MKTNISIHGALRIEYRVQLAPLGDNSSLIASERRLAGGEGAVSALALAALGACVRLSGNPIGDDSHGRFLLSQLQNVPALELELEVRPDVVTPYAILIRGAEGGVQTLLSPEAAELDGAQDYWSLLDALRAALKKFIGEHGGEKEIARLMGNYEESFGDFAFLRDAGS